jgi:hypothetical protein
MGEAEVATVTVDMGSPGSPAVGGTQRDNGIDIKVHNPGDSVAVVTGIRLTIDDVRELERCRPVGDELDVSQVYDVELPTSPGLTVEKPLSQKVRAGEADRFVVSVGVPGEDESAVFLLHGELTYNSGATVALGSMLVVTQFPLRNLYFVGTGDLDCEAANRAILEELLGSDAERAEELEEVADPAAVVGDAPGDSLRLESETLCGSATTASGGEVLVRLSAFEVACGEAIEVVEAYYAELSARQYRGDLVVDGWTCSARTAAEEAETGMAGTCDRNGDSTQDYGKIEMIVPPAS